MTDERRLLTGLAADLFADADVDAGEQDHSWSPTLWQKTHEAGLTLLGTPVEDGGSGGAFSDLAVVLLEAGRRAVPLPLAENALAAWILSRVGVAVPEGPLSIAVPSGDGGDSASSRPGVGVGVNHVAWARHARHMVLLPPGTDTETLSLVSADEVTIEPGTNIAAEPRDHVTVSDPPVTTAAISRDMIARIRYRDALARSLLIVGAASRVLSLTIAHAEQREQFGRPINRFQAVQHQLAGFAAAVELSRVVAVAAAAAIDRGDERSPVIAAARVQASNTAETAVSVGHQIHGAMGFTREHQLHRYTRRLMAWTEESGGQVTWARELGRFAISSGSKQLWEALTATPHDDGSIP